MRRKPKRRRLRLNWSPILWLAFITCTGAGLWFSPITSIRKVRIIGAPDWDRARLIQLAQSLKDAPATTLNPREVETRALTHSAVEDADMKRSLFGSATLTLQYRRPIARLEAAKDTYLDFKGALFQTSQAPAGLPVLRAHASALKPALTIAGGWPSARIAELIQQLPKTLKEKLRVEVDSEGAICLNTGAARILLGGADRLEEKLRTLEGMLAERPALLQQVYELNLTEPSRPAWKSLRPGASS